MSTTLYFLPTIVAVRRGHRHAGAVAVANVFLGWTGFAWVLTWAWACTGSTA
jgi:hypothetical protein